MKFRYQYRTKDNEVRSGEISAADRDAAYAALRANGIKASRMDEAPGFFNKLFGKGKRWIAIVLLAFAVVSAMMLWWQSEQAFVEAGRVEQSMPRHQIYGDPATVAKFSSYEGLKDVLGCEGDALLACYAQPGKIAVIPARVRYVELLMSAKTNELAVCSEDTREIQELKQIVNGIREELVAYVENTRDCRNMEQKFAAFYQRLQMRTAEERRIYGMTERELKNCTDERIRDEKNEKLRMLGLPTIAADEK